MSITPARLMRALAAALLALAGLATPARAEDLVLGQHEVAVQTGLTYGTGRIGASTPAPQQRALKFDLYRPLDQGKPMAGRPAVIMAFGGAFHRGTRGASRFEEDGASDSSMADWCQALARAGYVCLAIDYRLMGEDPAPEAMPDPAGLMPRAALEDPVATARIDVIRQRMGLPLLDARSRGQLWNELFAASEDVGKAVAYARAHGAELGLDPERLALGGFSAGASLAINVAYGAGAPVKAVLSLSGSPAGYDLGKTARAGMPPGLFFIGQSDLPAVQGGTRAVVAMLGKAGVPARAAWVPGFGHFYPMGAVSLGADLTRAPVLGRSLTFLEQTLGH